MSLAAGYLASISIGAAWIYSSDWRKRRKWTSYVKATWNELMISLDSKGQNKMEQKYELLEIYKKKYGFNAIVSIPFGTSIVDIRKLIGTIEIAYKANVIIEAADGNTSAYMRVYFKELEIEAKDRIKFGWYRAFSQNKYRNDFGETYKITEIENIINPNNKEVAGYKLIISIPSGLSYTGLLDMEESLSNSIGKSFVSWNNKNKKAEVQVITNPLSREERFAPIKVEAWELYTAMQYNYEPVILNFKKVPNCLVGGMPGSGKTVALIQAFLNLAYWNDRSKIRLHIGLISEKQDFRIFKKLDQTDYYAKNLKDSVTLLKYLVNETKKRNRLFDNNETFVTNIYEYNKNNKEQLPLFYFLTDEIANYMPVGTDSDVNKKLKEEFLDLFWKLSREGRSAGVYLTVATQRGDLQNMSSNIKANLTNKICFKQSNTASALTILGIGDKVATKVTRLDSNERECLIECQDGLVLAKTLHLDTNMMQEYIKSLEVKDKKYLYLDGAGKVIDSKKERIELVEKKEKSQKKNRFENDKENKKSKFKY